VIAEENVKGKKEKKKEKKEDGDENTRWHPFSTGSSAHPVLICTLVR
jgi:hypothetical protein